MRKTTLHQIKISKHEHENIDAANKNEKKKEKLIEIDKSCYSSLF